MRVSGIEGEAKRAIGFGVAELYTFVYRTPVGPVNIQIPREMAASAPQVIKFRIEWEGDEQDDEMRDERTAHRRGHVATKPNIIQTKLALKDMRD